MLAIVLENDQHSRDSVTGMLRNLGYTRVLHADHVDEAIFFFTREKHKVNLIVSTAVANYAEDLPLSRFLLKTPEMNLCPLVVSLDQWIQPPSSPFQSRFSRVDSVITKPFYEKHLYRAIIEAHERRAKLRNTLLVYGPDAAPELEESVFTNSRASHWKLVIRLQTKEELVKVLHQTEFRVGGIVFPANKIDADLIKDIRHFKRTAIGAITPMAVVGNHLTDMPHEMRLKADLFFEANVSSARLASKLSRRLIHHWEIQRSLKLIEAEPIERSEKKQMKSLLKCDPGRWEVLAAAGELFKDRKLLEMALVTNPYSPGVHLNLYQIAPASEKEEIAKQAKLFCPRHPEVLALEL